MGALPPACARLPSPECPGCLRQLEVISKLGPKLHELIEKEGDCSDLEGPFLHPGLGEEDTFKFPRVGALPNTLCQNWAQFGPGVDMAPPVCHPGARQSIC